MGSVAGTRACPPVALDSARTAACSAVRRRGRRGLGLHGRRARSWSRPGPSGGVRAVVAVATEGFLDAVDEAHRVPPGSEVMSPSISAQPRPSVCRTRQFPGPGVSDALGRDVSTTSPAGDEVQLVADHVGATVEQLERRIRARFGDRGLTRAARDLRRLVDAVQQSRPGQSHSGCAVRRSLARAISVTIVRGHRRRPGVHACEDAVTEGLDNGFDWLPLIESTINDLVFAAIAVLFLWAFPERLRAHDACSACCTGCGRWPTSSTCTSSPRTPSRSARPTPARRERQPRPRRRPAAPLPRLLLARCSASRPRPPPCAPSTAPTRSCSAPSPRSRR